MVSHEIGPSQCEGTAIEIRLMKDMMWWAPFHWKQAFFLRPMNGAEGSEHFRTALSPLGTRVLP